MDTDTFSFLCWKKISALPKKKSVLEEGAIKE